jgi:hypothetical protein
MVAQNLDLVRKRSAVRDGAVEGIVRKLLHRSPRAQLDGAPDIVKRQAADGNEMDAAQP